MKVLLDTSVYSQPLKKKPLPSVMAHWRLRPESDYAICSIVELEVLYCVFLARGTPAELSLEQGYQKILKGRFPLLPFDQGCALVYAQLQAEATKAGKIRPTFDLMIAATALHHRLALATCNANDFKGLEGLIVEDWSQ